ncbi:AAA family ATPase [Paludifilum halophilum]|uniref:DNA replication protein n=1 Tax=Paludifilum halophilum TaxID=1642702 RepID=A0A235B8D8_9BACL|nr:AAA family ATPase [Paludifilum halophilum]OYD08583.1 DNA replication protein [Paludifilum halophilum]
MNTNEKVCILSGPCNNAGAPDFCNNKCPYFVPLHGADGGGGMVARANIPADYRLATLSNSPVREEQERAYRLLDKYVTTFNRQFEDGAKQIKSLYLFSPPGTGKTYTASALANEYLTRHYLGSRYRGKNALERPAFFLSFNRWHSQFHAFNRRNVPEHIGGPAADAYYTAHETAKAVPFLVIDDIGVRHASEAFNMDVLDLVDARVSNLLPTVYTSNVPIDTLSSLYDDRVFDRVRDLCLPIEFEGGSKRGIR